MTGRSGSGKTTLLRLLAGLDRPDGGNVSLLGQPLADLGRAELAALRRRHVGIVPQESGLVPFLGARENIELGLLVRGIRDDAAARGRASPWVSPIASTCPCRASPRASVPVWRWRAPSSRVPPSCSRTSPPPVSTATARAPSPGCSCGSREQGTAIVCATHDRAVVEHADVSLVLRH